MASPPRPDRRQRVPPVILLVAATVIAFGQRQTSATLAPMLAAELGIGDAWLGLLHGPGFALSYGVMAIVGGRLVDRRRRIPLLAGGLALASSATAASALATNLPTLVMLRMLVGLGQAALVPATFSIVGDLLPARRNGRAAAMLACGPFVGAGLMALAGSAISYAADWPAAFLIAGVAGLVVAGAIGCVPEPVRTGPPPARHGFTRHLRARWKAILIVLSTMVCNAAAGHILLGWTTLWFVRAHGLAGGTASGLFGAALLVGGIGGTLAAGTASDALVRRGVPRLVVLAAAAFTGMLSAIYAFNAQDCAVAAPVLIVVIFCVAAAVATAPAVLQDLTPPAVRGRQHGVAVLLVNLVGAACGPWIVGVSSAMTGGPIALGQILAIIVPVILGLSALVAVVGMAAQASAAATLRQARTPGRPSSTA